MAEKELQFEEALERLEAVVEKLEAGNVPLDAALSYYEEGVSLIRLCNEKIDAAQQRVEAIRKTEKGFAVEPFGGEKA